MQENDLLEQYSDVPALFLPEGWHWRHYGDGSGVLCSPIGEHVIGYDRLPYFAAGWVEYQHYGTWSLYQDSFVKFISFAESLVTVRKGTT